MTDWVNKNADKGEKLKQATGTATVTAASVATFDPECTSFSLKNLSSTIKILWSVDVGTTYLTLEPLSIIEKAYIARSLYVKTTSGSAAYNVEYTERR